MSYVFWAIVAMGSYGVTAIFLKLALRQYPPEVALVITNLTLVLAGVALVVFRGANFADHVNLDRPTLYILLAGLTLSVSIISYYTALSRGPASVVVPIFSMSFAVAATLGMLLLAEDIKVTRILGVVLASGAIVLLAR